MGRPPIGERPMTATERVHRHRARLRGMPPPQPETKPETKPADATDPAENAQLRQRIAELEHREADQAAQIAKLRAEREQVRAERRAENTRLRAELAALDGADALNEWKAAEQHKNEAQVKRTEAMMQARVKEIERSLQKRYPQAQRVDYPELVRLREEREAIQQCIDNPSALPKKPPVPDLVLKIAKLQTALGKALGEIERLKKPPKPPLPPDEERDRQIKGLKTRIQNLQGELRYMKQHYDEAIAKAGGMPRNLRITIDKIVHPDTRNNMTEADKDEACRRWNVWKDSSRKAEDRKRR